MIEKGVGEDSMKTGVTCLQRRLVENINGTERFQFSKLTYAGKLTCKLAAIC
jgi:hypothetical protein